MEGLAKAHFIRQYAAEAAAFQCFQPLEAYALVRTQYRFQGFRQGIVAIGYRFETAYHFAELAVTVDTQAAFAGQQPIKIQSTECRHRHLAGSKVLGGKLEHMGHFREFFARGTVQRHITPVRKTVITPFFQQALIKCFKLLRRESAGIQRNLQQPAGGYGNANRPGLWLDAFFPQAVSDENLTHCMETIKSTGQKIIYCIIPRQRKQCAVLFKLPGNL